MPKRKLLTHKRIQIDGIQREYSHYIWFVNTGHWPVDDEIIHHIDGDHWNDEFSNLALMTHSEHTHLHHIGSHHSKETHAKIGEAKRGERNPN